MITKIKLAEDKFEGYEVQNGKSLLDGLNRINVFIGPNNSGKSRFLRAILKNVLPVQTDLLDHEQLLAVVKDWRQKMLTFFPDINFSQQFKAKIQKYHFPLFYIDNGELSKLKGEISTDTDYVIDTLQPYVSSRPGLQTRLFFLRTDANEIVRQVSQVSDGDLNFTKIYIPILRGLRPIQQNEDGTFTNGHDSYGNRIVKDYQIKKTEQKVVHTGLDIYNSVAEHLFGSAEERESIQEFQAFISETFFDGQKVDIVPRKNKDVLEIKIGKDEQFPIYDLGDGIQAVLNIIYPLFINRGKNVLFFIEEPELHLHPGLERLLVQTLFDDRFKSFQYFITTHSNHFLDLAFDYPSIAIFKFQKKEVGERSVVSVSNSNRGEKQILDLLGVRNSSVFLANCTIWVEGVTDRLYLKKFLEVFLKANGGKLIEDYHYTIVEYSGGNITHWSFLENEREEQLMNVEALCSKFFLIVDNDGVFLSGSPKVVKKQRLEKLKKVLGDNVYITEGIEMENLLLPEIVKKVIKTYPNVNSNADFSQFDQQSYKDVQLGEFIDMCIPDLGRTFSEESGTIKDKVNFCRKAISFIESKDDLSAEGLSLAKKVYEFIKKSNR